MDLQELAALAGIKQSHTLRNCLIGGVALLIVAYGALTLYQHNKAAHSAQQAIQSVADHGEAIAHATQAQTNDTQAKQQAQALADADAKVAQLKHELASLRSSKPSDSEAPVGAPSAGPLAPVGGAGLDAVVAKQDQVIQAQDTQIQGLKLQVTTLTASRDQWKAAYEAESRASTAKQLALEAQIAATKASRWRGRIEGFAVGVGVGYVGGKL